MSDTGNAMTKIGSASIRIFKKYTMLFVLAGLVLMFSIITPSFFSVLNLNNLIVQNSYIVVVAVGVSFIMMSGSLDLSVGWQMSAIGVLTAKLMTVNDMNPYLAMACGIALGLTFGFINGAVAVVLKIEPLVVTIATALAFSGVSYLISGGAAFNTFPDSFRQITKGVILGMPVDVVLAIIAVAAASFVYNYTYFGRYVKAMGGNPEATRLAGVQTGRLRILTFVISGLFVAVAAFILISKTGTTNSSVGPGTEITALTAAVLGGISFNSGEGKMWGLVTGVFVLAVISNGMQLAGWNQYIQLIVKGVILVAAIGYDNYNRNAAGRRKRLQVPPNVPATPEPVKA
ncbi:ABC transporter permease [Demequina capsici]|uniref:Autoinducer 2 import system permease protein LsrD n=1 Tax=Demequina capsici TaxID=3075620 RepID=A0AA96JAA5_9MICO|nr:ABC transporter permease [Demequina sp. PMTSA13]WNM27225.1 ABC transporter permease [Demequina sp. PMTSA13]